jgi:cytochrome P450
MMKSDERLGRLLTDPKAYAQWWELQDSLAIARRDSPVSRVEPDGFDPFWVLAKFDDIREVERQPDIFRQNGVRVGLHSRASLAEAEKQPPTLSMVVFDGVDHQNLRGITAGWFGAARVKKLEERLRPLAKAAVSQMLAGGDACEFSEDVALRYPLSVICSILGVPPQDEEIILAMTQKYFSSGRNPKEQNSPTNLDALTELSEYFTSMTNERRRTPRDDIASVIANAVVNGELLDHAHATAYYATIATAGHDTTSSTLAGAVWAFCEHPDQYQLLREQPKLISKIADEAVRWTTPVQQFMRTAAQPYELRGQQIERGDWMLLCYPSGNRDEEIYQDPHRFDVTRSPNNHVGFGYGAHMCLGMQLARLEIQLFFEELLPRVRSIELDGTPERASSYFVGGPNYVPIRFAAA